MSIQRMLAHAQEHQQTHNPNDESQYRPDLPEHIGVERRHKGSQAVPQEKQSKTPIPKSSHFTISLSKLGLIVRIGQFYVVRTLPESGGYAHVVESGYILFSRSGDLGPGSFFAV